MTKINKTPISSLSENSSVDAWVLIRSAKVQTAQNNHQYIGWEGMDAAGRSVRGTLFEDKCNGILPTVGAGEVWSIGGSIGSGRMGAMVFAGVMVRVMEPELIDQFMGLCIPTLPEEELKECVETIENWAKTITDTGLRQLAGYLWAYMNPFMGKTPAAKAKHEPYRGGLAKHTSDVLLRCAHEADWNLLNKDVLVFSAIFHDIGKIRAYDDLMNMTHEGKLIPHSFMAIELIAEIVATQGLEIDAKLLTHVKHCLITHHGEFSEISPATREAYVLHQADMTASKLGHFTEIIKSGSIGNDGWSGYDKDFDGSVYIPEMDNLQ